MLHPPPTSMMKSVRRPVVAVAVIFTTLVVFSILSIFGSQLLLPVLPNPKPDNKPSSLVKNHSSNNEVLQLRNEINGNPHKEINTGGSLPSDKKNVNEYAGTVKKGTIEFKDKSKSKKPTLILHVGPMKSGTTFIQMNLLGNKRVQKILLQDNVTLIEFNYIKFGQLKDQCLSRVDENQEECEDDALWKDFLRLLDDAYHPGTTVIHSTETYSTIPDNKFTINLLRSLQEKWNVKVLVFHRRPSGWFPSMYHQKRKSMMYMSRSGRYKGYPNPNAESMLTFPKFLEEQELHNWDSWSTAELFQRIFGEANVRILNFHASNLAVEFLCEGIDAPTACAWAQNNTFQSNNANNFLLFDEDLLVMEAHRQGLFQPAKHFVDRHEATLRIKPYLDDDARTHLPMVCLSQDQKSIFFNRDIKRRLQKKCNTVLPFGCCGCVTK
jgi:hypothetical protein